MIENLIAIVMFMAGMFVILGISLFLIVLIINAAFSIWELFNV